jgi:hypothetical protein
MNDDLLKISLNQGKQFNTYQTKIKKNITKTDKTNKRSFKKEGFVTLEQEQMIRPSFDGYSPVLKNMQQTTSITNNANQRDLDELKQLQSRYNTLIQQYTDIQKKIGDSSLNTINRLSSNNPYLNKTIRFTTGHICYVTNQGVVKYIPSPEIWDSVNAPKNFININIPYDNSYQVPGTQIPTNPPLISGTNVQKGQTLGNEGSNVYASNLLNNPSSTYIGCYNDKPPSSNINIVPVMNSSNYVNGFGCGSTSIYLGDNNSFGPWAAFDQNPNTFWHSEVSAATNYNDSTGVYEGNNGVYIVNIGLIPGEFIEITMPGINTSSAQNIQVTQYSLSPRLDNCCLTTRNPNSWYILGWKDNQWYQVDRRQNQMFTNGTPKVYNVSSPGSYSAYILLVDKVGNDDQKTNRYCVQVAGWNLFINSDSTFTNDKRAMIWNPDMIGYTSFDKCQEFAVDNGYKYFGLQSIMDDGTAACLVSNDIARTQMYGDASRQVSWIPIWSSNTSTGERNYFELYGTGQIAIVNPNNGSIVKYVNDLVSGCQNWGTISINSATYGGNCKVPIGNVTNKVAGDLKCNWSSSCSIPISNQTFGDPAPGCPKSFDIDYTCGGKQFTKNLGYAEGQTMIIDCSQYMQENCSFVLVLQDDGNMVVYREGGEAIWATGTNSQKKSPNPDWVASKGKFGRNYLKSGEGLLSDEWIGSTDGSLKLIMQTDGNLVLYTSETNSGCKVINDKTYGDGWINAVYQLNGAGDRATLGKIGYVDSNSDLKEYPDSMVGFTNDYQIYPNTDSGGHDIGSSIVTDQNGCQTFCNNNPECAAYAYQDVSKGCWIKDKTAFPKGEKQLNSSVVLGVRKPGLKGSTTCSNKISNIDTIQFDNYLKGSFMTPDTQCNPSVVSQSDQLEFDNIKSQLITLGNNIVSKMESLYNQDKRIFKMLNTNEDQFKKDLENYKLTNLKIKKELELQNLPSNNIEGMQNLNMNDLNGMLSDSDLRVLQGNYSYIMWSILAVGVLTITINTMKK